MSTAIVLYLEFLVFDMWMTKNDQKMESSH